MAWAYNKHNINDKTIEFKSFDNFEELICCAKAVYGGGIPPYKEL